MVASSLSITSNEWRNWWSGPEACTQLSSGNAWYLWWTVKPDWGFNSCYPFTLRAMEWMVASCLYQQQYVLYSCTYLICIGMPTGVGRGSCVKFEYLNKIQIDALLCKTCFGRSLDILLKQKSYANGGNGGYAVLSRYCKEIFCENPNVGDFL